VSGGQCEFCFYDEWKHCPSLCCLWWVSWFMKEPGGSSSLGQEQQYKVCWTPHLNSNTTHLNSKPLGIRFIGPRTYILLNIHVFIQCGTFISNSLHHYLSLKCESHLYIAQQSLFHSMWDFYLTLYTTISLSGL